jgi:ATP adenylyltransferase
MDLKDFSYNIGMTTSAIILCPRISEGVTLRASDGSEVGTVALNGSFLSGGALVKRREEWEHLRMSPSALDEVLVGIGVPLKANL